MSLRIDKDKYNPNEIEQKWQSIWEESKIYQPNLDRAKKPFYNLMMFPYPSAEGMHVGNMYAFTGSDIYGRFKRMQGHDVFEPIGLDGFGIHSENFAIQVGRHPKEQAKISEKNFYRQLRATGNAFDWSRTVETYDPQYYKWTQWIFIQLFKKGLAYRKKSPVNWCPKDKTVLADEQVIDGKCERCGSQVEKKDLEQWFFRITKYANRLLTNIAKLDWTEKVKIAQREWIGRKEGINITYEVEGSKEKIVCFTTRPDTNFGATFIVLGPEHRLIDKLSKKEYLDKVKKYVKNATSKSDIERMVEGRKKTGVFTGSYAINNLNGKRLPVWVADFVLGNVGTGAVVGVPGHDKRDFEFAQAVGLPVVRVVVGSDGDKSEITRIEQVQEEEGKMINSEFLNGLDIQDAIAKMMDYLEEKGFGKRVVTYHLRDWLISRQRYWGPPIPMIHCDKCAHSASSGQGWNPVPEDQLPVKLPDVKDWKPMGIGKSPLANHPEFYETVCPNCGGKATRETDVSDTFLDSSWYFFRYLATDRDDVPFPMASKDVILRTKSEESQSKPVGGTRSFANAQDDIGGRERWLPVTMYIGGAEHSVLHLLYSRFLTMAFHDMGFAHFEEPFTTFRAHGLVIKDGAKMSKSKGNVVVPDEYIKKFGADALRTYLMFTGPYTQGGDFRDSGIEGMHRFVKRVWVLLLDNCHPELVSGSKSLENEMPKQVRHDIEGRRVMHKTIKKVTEDIANLRYNTAIAALMEWYNYLSSKFKVQSSKLSREEAETYLKLLAPFAPHMTEELYQNVILNAVKDPSADSGQRLDSSLAAQNDKGFRSIHTEHWPKYDPKYLKEEELTIVVQINGRVRDTLRIPSGQANQKQVEQMARESDKVKKYLEGKTVLKTVYVEGKIINFVT